MQYTTLGKTGVQVSRLCFGTMSFGGDADESTSAHMFHRCREAGINFFDTANVYSQGKSEEILGTLIRGQRDDLVITSKVYGQMGNDRNCKGLSRRNIMLSVEESLRRLDTDRLDVYFCHMFDATVPIEETLLAMDDLVRQGKILYPGVSNWAAWQIAKGLGLAELLKVSRLYVIQPMYNLVKRVAEIEILPLAKDAHLGVITYSPLGGGLLTGKYDTRQRHQDGRLTTNKNYSVRYGNEDYYRIAEDFTNYARKAGTHPATLALAWVKAHPAVTAPIIGARDLQQLEPSLAAADYDMSAQQWEEIAALTPAVPLATDRTEEAKGLSVFRA
jgi:aryl-alcohol dehydrogenase-like predicted oxidoreductase